MSIDENTKLIPFVHLRRTQGIHCALAGEFRKLAPYSSSLSAKRAAHADGHFSFVREQRLRLARESKWR